MLLAIGNMEQVLVPGLVVLLGHQALAKQDTKAHSKVFIPVPSLGFDRGRAAREV